MLDLRERATVLPYYRPEEVTEMEQIAPVDPQVGVPIPCPACGKRIGNERRTCRTCNNFAQKVLRRSARELQRRYNDEYRVIRAEVERGLYSEMMAGTSAFRS